MSFTRFHDDPDRIQKNLQQSTGTSNYQLNAPGPGLDTPFMEDPHLRLQRWGANMMSNSTNLESDLKGLTHKLSRDQVNFKSKTPFSALAGAYSNDSTVIVDETRASNPAWTIRDLEQTRWADTRNVHKMSLASIEIPFSNNESTRILEKDSFSKNAK